MGLVQNSSLENHPIHRFDIRQTHCAGKSCHLYSYTVVSGSLRRVGQGFRCIYELYRVDYAKHPTARTAILWNICRTGVRSFDPTVVPFVLEWMLSRMHRG